MTYKLTRFNTIIRLADGANISQADGNRDCREYLDWLAEGNEPEPANAPPLPPADWRGFLAALWGTNDWAALPARTTLLTPRTTHHARRTG